MSPLFKLLSAHLTSRISDPSSYEEINVIFFNNGVTASIITPQSNKEDM